MARYFFDVVDGETTASDPEGVELDGLESVRKEALASAKDLVADELKAGHSGGLDRRFEVRDEAGEIVLERNPIRSHRILRL